LPFWTLASEQTGIHSTLELGLQLPILFLIPLLSLGISALMITNMKANMAQIIAAGLALIIGALFIVFNGLYMNTSDRAPVPSDVAITLTLFTLAAIIACGVRAIVLAKQKAPTTQEG
jgi:drug/metabolite transporter (DMT)-like permease